MDITINESVIAILGVGVALAGLILKPHRDTNSRIVGSKAVCCASRGSYMDSC